MKRFMAVLGPLAVLLLMPASYGVANASSVAPASGSSAIVPYSFNWSGGATAPVTWNGSGSGSNWDVLVHTRGTGDAMQPTVAQHGADCAAPPATHVITTLADSVFICRNHVMTSVTDAGYGADVLVPDHMADFSQGETVIGFSTSTVHVDARDYYDIWITPFVDNLMVPITDNVDLQGPPKNAVRVRDCFCGNNTDQFTASVFSNFVETPLPQASGATLQNMIPMSSTTRTPFQLRISQNHLQFGVPSVNTWWINTPINLSWNQGIVQIIHHSYDACKDQSTSLANPCVADTWHWSDFYITQSMPFAILNGDRRSASAQTGTTVHFGGPAPSNSFLRFEALSGGMQVSFDGGATFQAAREQAFVGDHGTIHPDHFAPYFTPVPAGAQSVVFRGTDWYGGPWFVRDPSIWSAQGVSIPPPVQASPSAPPGGNPSPGATPTGSTSPPPTGGGDESPPPSGGGDESPAPSGGGDESPAPSGGGSESAPSTGGGGEKPTPGEGGGGGGESPPVSTGGVHPTPSSVATNVQVRLAAAMHSPTAPVLGVLALVGVLLLLFVVRSIWKSRRPGENPPS